MRQGVSKVLNTLSAPSYQNASDSDTESNTPNGPSGAAEEEVASDNSDYASNPFDEKESMVFVLFKQANHPLKYARPRVVNTTTIHEIKNELFVEWGVPIAVQRLLVDNVELEDNSRTLKDYGIDISKICSITLIPTIEIPEIDISLDDPEKENTSPSNRSYSPSTYMTNYSMRGDGEDLSDNEYDLFDKRPSHDLVGLKNQGATCYLNSLIQVLYLTPEFRRMIYRVPRPYEALLAEKPQEETKERKEDKEPDDIFEEGEDKENKQDIEKKDGEQKSDQPDRKKDIIFQMQMLFARMQFCNVSSVSTTGLTTSFGWDNSDIFVQHDVQELNRVLCDNIEEKMKGKEGEYSIAKLYKGIMLNMIKCMNCNRVSTREEDYYDISLVIKGKKTILESFNEFTEIEKMENENAYLCEKCDSKQTAEKSIRFKTSPIILNLQLKRFEFNWDANIRVKLNDEISFPSTLDMSPYMVDPNIISELNKDKEIEEPKNESLIYELVAILVHSGNAGFGHYYAFIKNFTDGKWYKFNDEHVTQVDETDVIAQNWIGAASADRSTGYGYSASMTMQRSATPYMLVYRKRELPEKMDEQSHEESDSPFLKSIVLEDFKANPVSDEEIPSLIHDYLIKDREKKEAKRREREREQNSCHVTVFRNRVELPIKMVKVDKNITLEELRCEVIAAVSNESPTQYSYRFRRMANRKNHTRRPMQLYKESDYEKSLVELGLDKRLTIYLEQDADPTFPGLEQDFDEDTSFVSLRLWSKELRRPTSIKDFIFPKTMTLAQVKLMLCEKYVKLQPEETVLVEEETETQINILQSDIQTIRECGVISGDILHLEPLSKEHYSEKGLITFSFTQLYYIEKHNKLTISITENNASFKRRNKEFEQKDIKKIKTSEDMADWSTHKIGFKIVTNKTHTLGNLKTVIALKIGVDPRLIRLLDKDAPGEGKLLKDLNGKMGTILVRFGGARISTHLALEILEYPEDIKKGDKLLKTRYYNANHEFGGLLEIKVNKSETLRDFKTKLREKTGVPEELQVLSEWYNEHFFKLFPTEKETIGQARIRKNDVLRMDAISDPFLNISDVYNNGHSVFAFQLVQFINWDTTPYGRKEMQTSFPELLTIPETASLYDLRLAVAERAGVPFHNINVATASSFPIYEGSITPIKELSKGVIVIDDVKDPDDEASMKLAEQENRDGKSWNFKIERKVQLNKLRLKHLDVVCWEDMRKKAPEKPVGSAARSKWKSRDGEDLKIKN